ncbi:VIT1/CCC1 family protein [Rothia sp. (in: high G+C Gram-positive bacteria)]|uniref:VIT1/CCC1 transporter family protein n=1 Tax=Rothia sp. (in: high G+C Gram-positive bacteria) TaxID=1885016 RepID=UPI001CB3FFA7|nr:VIT1/CCC1 family protein [Rothia sp. (in: high G+C Gram-positive bacteria)]MBF1655078.1 VIT1/CCC1 transporter family protein [Rothia sp. (in: high G+C Gram-positive bacteria)]
MSTHAPNEHGEDTYGEQTEKLQADAAEHKPTRHSAVTSPSPAQIKRWRRYLADEESEARVYRYLARRAEGTDREILLQVAEAEKRHQQHWRDMLGEHADVHVRPSMQSLVLQFLAKNFGSVFILAMAQRAESRSPYAEDPDATEEMAADEAIHEEIIRALATSGREKLSGNFRAAVFGANDGLVSNLALTMGITASGASSSMVLLSGIAGLLAGALSMAAGEFVSVRSQRELLDASQPTQVTLRVAHDLDLDSNELELIYRARGMEPDAAHHRAMERFGYMDCDCDPSLSHREDEDREENVALGTDIGAAAASFAFFASGALVPILPYIFGLSGVFAMVLSLLFVGAALGFTGGVVGLLSGASPLKRGIRQILIGFGAAFVTYLLGLAFGTTVG